MTPRRIEWLQLKAEGFTTTEICNIMCISPSCERSHQADVVFALEARSTIHAVAIGIRKGIIK